MQTMWKEDDVQNNHQDKFQKQLQAATLIQAAWKGYAVRKNLQNAFASFHVRLYFGQLMKRRWFARFLVSSCFWKNNYAVKDRVLLSTCFLFDPNSIAHS